MTSIQEWNEQYGDMQFFSERSGGYDWQMDVAYPCKITSAKVTKSNRGDLQVEMSLSIQATEDEDAKVLGTERQWLDLPMQASDKDKPRETVEKMTQRRFGNLLCVYRAAMPSEFAPYHRVEERGGKKIYFDFDDKEMSTADFNKRKQDTQGRIVQVAAELHEQEDKEIEDLAGALLYVSKAENPRNDKYPYVNYSATKPRNKPVYSEVSEEVPF